MFVIGRALIIRLCALGGDASLAQHVLDRIGRRFQFSSEVLDLRRNQLADIRIARAKSADIGDRPLSRRIKLITFLAVGRQQKDDEEDPKASFDERHDAALKNLHKLVSV
ncbi:MAG: hypothetical protein WBP94_12950 [Rhodomicrobiaceae bacterium]